MTRVGWVGLGAMSLPMAHCVARAGYRPVAYDLDPSRATSLATDRVKPAASIPEVAAGADVWVLMVATPDQAEDVLFGDDPAAPSLAPGSVVMVMATVGPAAVQHWADRLAEHQVNVVDAPVSGGVARAAAGDLLVMVSGPQAAVERVQPLLDAMASSAPVVGSVPGDGQKVKLVNQLLCGVHIAVTAEALAFAEAMHLDPAATWEIVRGGAAASFMLDDRGERMVHGSGRPRARWTSSSMTWDSCWTRLAQAAIPRHWPPPPSSCFSPAVAQDSADMTTRPSSRFSAAARLRRLFLLHVRSGREPFVRVVLDRTQGAGNAAGAGVGIRPRLGSTLTAFGACRDRFGGGQVGSAAGYLAHVPRG